MFKKHPMLSLIIIILFIQFLFGSNRLQAFLQYPLSFLFLMLSILIALVIHEFAHALAADQLGDPNPRLDGRVSLNPLKHLDPLGTLLIVIIGFGWGKPVAFDPYNLKDPVKDGALIAAAGPLSNIFLAIICALFLRFLPLPFMLGTFIHALFQINLVLAIFNLIPIYPLDGHHILRTFFTPQLRANYDLFNRQFGFLVAFLLIFPLFGSTSPIHQIMDPTLKLLNSLLLGI